MAVGASFIRSIQGRLAAIIVLAMVALVGFLIYQTIDERNRERERGEENLTRLATFAAYAERERFDAAERLLVLAAQSSEPLRRAALNPSDDEAYAACTRTLFTADQLLPGTSGFALWDTSGRQLCSSEGAERGQYSVTDRLWFQTAASRRAFATGGFELSPPDDEPSLGFGSPIFDAGGQNVIAYLSTGLSLTETDELLAGTNLPETGRLAIVDATGQIINSTGGRSGVMISDFTESFGSLSGFRDAALGDGPDGRIRAVVRITDGDDTPVSVLVSAEKDAIVDPLTETLVRELSPVLIVTLLTLAAVWFLAQRWVVSPVGALAKASERIAAGDLGARAEVPGGVREFDRLAEAFNEMAATRERASEAKDEFLGLVSHELKTPITTALGNAEILRKRGDRLDPEMRQSALDDIHESALRLAAIIDNLLVLARMERGAELESEPLALLRIAQAAVDDLLREAPARRVLVRGDSTVLALGGQMYVEQVVRNLVGNALKYSPADTTVEVTVEDDSAMAIVRVRDHGRGIDQSEQESVFLPFHRSERTAAGVEGVGIGLSVCRRLIEAMGGRIWCAAPEGGGCEFGFTLPLVAEAAQPSMIEDLPELRESAMPAPHHA